MGGGALLTSAVTEGAVESDGIPAAPGRPNGIFDSGITKGATGATGAGAAAVLEGALDCVAQPANIAAASSAGI